MSNDAGHDQVGKRELAATAQHDEAHGRLLNDAISSSPAISPKAEQDNKVWICYQPPSGQYIEKNDLDAVTKQLNLVMTDLAKDISKANSGAEIEVTGALQSNYEGTYCRGAGARPHELVIGQGKSEGPLKLPDEKALGEPLGKLLETYKNSLKGDPIGDLHIAAELSVHRHSKDNEDETLKTYSVSTDIPQIEK